MNLGRGVVEVPQSRFPRWQNPDPTQYEGSFEIRAAQRERVGKLIYIFVALQSDTQCRYQVTSGTAHFRLA